MAILAGDHVQVLVDGYELTADSNRIVINDMVDTYDVTAFSDQVHRFIRGSRMVALDHAGYMDAGTARSHPVLKGNGINGVVSVIVGQNASPIMGDIMYSFASLQGKYSTLPEVGKYVPIAARFANRGALGGWGVSLGVNEVFNTSKQPSAVDNGVSTTNGGVAFLHILTAIAPTDTYDFRVQDSDDGTTFSNLGFFTLNGTSIGSEHLPISGTIKRYVRYRAIRTGSSGDNVKISVNLVRY